MEQQTPTGKASPMELARLKSAADEYKVHKSIFIDPVTEVRLEGFMEWPAFRDEFLADWKSNRRVVTEKEADVHFDKIADESLSELEQIGAPTDVAALAEQVAPDSDADDSDTGPFTTQTPQEAAQAVAQAVVAPKRRGRPPGSGKKTVPGARSYLPKTEKVLRKVAAKKKGGNTSTKAQAIVEKYGPAGRGWSRKDVIAKLTASIKGLGAAYASTLYQKFA